MQETSYWSWASNLTFVAGMRNSVIYEVFKMRHALLIMIENMPNMISQCILQLIEPEKLHFSLACAIRSYS